MRGFLLNREKLPTFGGSLTVSVMPDLEYTEPIIVSLVLLFVALTCSLVSSMEISEIEEERIFSAGPLAS